MRLEESESIIDLLNRRILEEKNKQQLISNSNTEKSEKNDFEPFDQSLSEVVDEKLKKRNRIQPSPEGTRGVSIKYPELRKYSELISSSSKIFFYEY